MNHPRNAKTVKEVNCQIFSQRWNKISFAQEARLHEGRCYRTKSRGFEKHKKTCIRHHKLSNNNNKSDVPQQQNKN